MSDEPKMGDALTTMLNFSEGTAAALLDVIFVLAKRDIIPPEVLKEIADRFTTKVPPEQYPAATKLFQSLLPGYEPPKG